MAAIMKFIQKLESSGYIKRRVALLDAEKLNLGVSVFIAVRTNQHIVNALAVPRYFDCRITRLPARKRQIRSLGGRGRPSRACRGLFIIS
jgi:DNA-binding Lrp family transcriptional regulator